MSDTHCSSTHPAGSTQATINSAITHGDSRSLFDFLTLLDNQRIQKIKDILDAVDVDKVKALLKSVKMDGDKVTLDVTLRFWP